MEQYSAFRIQMLLRSCNPSWMYQRDQISAACFQKAGALSKSQHTLVTLTVIHPDASFDNLQFGHTSPAQAGLPALTCDSVQRPGQICWAVACPRLSPAGEVHVVLKLFCRCFDAALVQFSDLGQASRRQGRRCRWKSKGGVRNAAITDATKWGSVCLEWSDWNWDFPPTASEIQAAIQKPQCDSWHSGSSASKAGVFLSSWRKSFAFDIALLSPHLCPLHRHTLSRVRRWYKIDCGQATTGCAAIISIHKEAKMNYPVDFLIYAEKLTSRTTVIT